MTAPLDEAQLRHWLLDYLVTNIGCSPVDVDLDASLNDLGVGSKDAVVLSGELSELLGRPVSPVEFWEHSTINSLARFLAASSTRAASEPDTASAVPDATVRNTDGPIAVIGLGCRLPGDVAGPEEFWEFLQDNTSAVTEVPPQRWARFDDGTPEVAAAIANTTRWGSFLRDIDAFDADFFEISPHEADAMDPQQRLLLEVAYEALEHAGIPAQSLRHSQTGVFAGACLGEYGYLATSDLSQVDSWSGTGGALSIIANRVSYYFDLRGPSVTVDTACSSSLVAIHLACQSLRSGEANLAIAAGVNLLLSPAVTRSFDRAEAMSPTGQCHAFDASADGFVRGEGCGAVVLKRLGDALRDGDRILAVVRGSAVNQDGRSNGLMAPNPAAQMAVLRAAYANAGVEPREVDYVEAHGTGTLLGDPIEARALGSVLGRARPADTPLLIGAVKSNIGHLEAAAGIVGFIKTVLSVQHGRIPANVRFENPNPHIPFENLRLKVVAEHTSWPSVHRPRRAGVSSFGFGGTNAHVVLEEAPVARFATPEPPSAVTTLVVSAKTEERVASYAGSLADWLELADPQVDLADVAHTLDHHRARHAKFATVVAADRATAVVGLRALAEGGTAAGVVAPHHGICRPGTVFVYSGQGSQWAGMGRRLLTDEPAFAAAVADLEPAFVEQVGFSLLQVLSSAEPVTGIARIQPVLVGVQLALTELWRSYGVEPDAVIGHSMGEVTAAVVAGALTPADGLRVIATRSRLMSRLSGQGAMALVELAPEDAETLVATRPGAAVAVYASPRQSVIAGSPDQVDALVAVVAAQDRLARRIDVDVASHHPTIDPVLPELRAALSDLSPRTPTITLFSTTDSSGGTDFDADYWVNNLRRPVRFSQAVAAAGADHATFVEVSPHPLLTYAIDDSLDDIHHHSIGTLHRDTHDTIAFHTNLNATHTVTPPTSDHAAEPHPVLPPAPWHRTRHWISPRTRPSSAATAIAPKPGTLLGAESIVATTPPTHVWRSRISPEARPYPGSHRIQGLEVVPASILLQTMSAAAGAAGATVTLSDIRFEHPITLDAERDIQVVSDREALSLSSSATDSSRWVRHVRARLASAPSASETAGVVAGRSGTRSAAELQHIWDVEGQPFEWSVTGLWHTETGCVAHVTSSEAAAPSQGNAALVDAALHVARLVDLADERFLVPSAMSEVRYSHDVVADTATVDVRRRSTTDSDLVVDVTVTATDGTTCVEITGLRYTAVDADTSQRRHVPETLAHVLDWLPWTPPSDPTPAQKASVAIVGGGAHLRDALRAAGFPEADVARARYVVYVAESLAGESDIDAGSRMSDEVSGVVRQLAQRDHRTPATLSIVTHAVREALSTSALAQSCLWGIGAVIGAEQPQLWGGVIDVADAGDLRWTAAIPNVLANPSKSVLAYREGQFLQRELAPIAGAPTREPLRCRPDAAYLVTGGLGALGLLIAGWLADRGARRLVLTGRTALPPRRLWDSTDLGAAVRGQIAAVRALELRGVAVDVARCDVGSAEAVRELLAARDEAGAPPIRGIVHAAGITENALLTDMTVDSLQRVMWPKIAGAQTLHEAFGTGELDFMFFTASAGAVFGVPGQGAYAAANSYLDCLAAVRTRQGSHTVSLDWVAWNGYGFAVDAGVVAAELARLGSRPVEPGEAFEAWEHVVRYDVAQAVMAPLPSAQDSDSVVAESAERWDTLTAAEAAVGIEAGLRTILARELRISETELESDRPFAELGLNSLMAMSIRREAEQLVGVELSATMLWNHPTISALAAYLVDRMVPATAADDRHAVTESDQAVDDNVLDSLFDSIESSPLGAEGGF